MKRIFYSLPVKVKMGVDYIPCDNCGNTFCDGGDYDTCENCGSYFCVECRDNNISLLYDEDDEDREECIFCTKDYTKRHIKNKEIIKYLMSKCGYKEKEEVRKVIRKEKIKN